MRNWNQKKNPVKAWIRTLALAAALLATPAFAAKEDVPAFARVPYALADEQTQPKISELDGTKIMGITTRWLTDDSLYNNEGQAVTTSEERLFLATDSNAELAMNFQVEVEFSGQYDYKPGDIRITIPAQVWHARQLTEEEDGEQVVQVGSVSESIMIGSMELPVPEKPEVGYNTSADFNWERVGDNYVLTNVRTIAATSSYTFKVAIRGLTPMDVVDMSVSDPIQAYVEVITNQGNPLNLESNQIDAQVDTIAKITDAHKTGEVFAEYRPNMIPSRLLDNLPEGTDPDDYVYVRWTSHHSRTNNQPFSMKIEDVISDAVDNDGKKVTDGIFLGSTNFDGTLAGKEFDAQISDYSTTAADGVYYGDTVYMWSAYLEEDLEPVSATEPEAAYHFTNKITWTMTEADAPLNGDERKVTSETATSTVTYSPIEWRRPLGRFGVDKWTESVHNKDWLYGYALNRLEMGEQADMSFIVRTTGYGYPWTSEETAGMTFDDIASEKYLDETDPDSYGRLGWKQVTEDFQTFFNYEEKPLTHKDFQFKSLEVTEPYKMRYGRNAAGGFDYIADDTLPNPDLVIEYKTEGGEEWIKAATATWGVTGRGAMTFTDLGTGIAVDGRKVIFPQNTTDVRHTFVSNVFGGNTATKCDIAAIRWDVYPEISLKPSERIQGIVKTLLENNNEPSTKFKNDVSMDAYGWVGREEHENIVVNNDFDYSRATLESAGYGVHMEKSVHYNPANKDVGDNDVQRQQVILHYTGVVTEQSSLKNRFDYMDAVAAGVIPAETSGVFYDLLPENVVPVLSSVKLRDKDVITNMYTVPNYQNTGRMLLVVEADLTPVPVYDPKTMPGWGDKPTITFDAIYTWRDLENNKTKNVMNYMAFESTVDNLRNNTLGTIEGETGEPDNPRGGQNTSTPNMPKDIADALINLDPDTDENRFVYSKADTTVNVVTYTASNLDKMVSDDLVGIWTQGLNDMEQVSVFEGHGYTYRLRVSSSVKATKDIVIYDSLENYKPDGSDINKKADYDHVNARDEWEGAWNGKGQWRGTLQAVDLHELIEANVAPVLYYWESADGAPVFPSADDDSSENQWAQWDVFKLGNGKWKKVEATDITENGLWVVPENTIVTGIAIDASMGIEGNAFVLQPDKSFSAYLKMKAPEGEDAKGAYARPEGTTSLDSVDWDAATNPVNNMYAFNNTYLSHRQGDETGTVWNEDLRVIYNDYTRVGIQPQILTLEKIWDDENNHDGIRPQQVNILLQRKAVGKDAEGKPLVEWQNVGSTILPNEQGEWKASFKQMDVIDEKGERYEYRFIESLPDGSEVAGYESKVQFVATNKFKLINVHPIEMVEISGEKIWADDDNALGLRPAYITLDLYRDGRWYDSKVVYPDAEGKWKYTFGELEAKKPGGKAYVYTVEEEYVPKYGFDGSNLAQLVNEYDPYGDLEVRKIVNNGTAETDKKKFTFTLELRAEQRDDSIVIKTPLEGDFAYTIYNGDGTPEKTGKISHGGTFKLKADQRFVIKGLPSEIEYRVTEAAEAGFTTTYTNDWGYIQAGRTQQSVFTNTYSASGSIALEAEKELDGRVLYDRQFEFKLLDSEGNVISTARNGAPTKIEGEGKGEAFSSTAKVIFDNITYTEKDHGKTFTYKVCEVAEEGKPGYTYDRTVYTVKVLVTDNGDGTMKATPTYTKPDDTAVNGALFANKYEASGNLVLDAQKLLRGADLAAGDFTFELFPQMPEGEDLPEGWPMEATNDAQGHVTFGEIEFTQDDVSTNPDQPAEYVYVIREQKGDDENIIYSEAQYIVTVKPYDNGDGTINFAIDNQEVVIPDNTCPTCNGEKYYVPDYMAPGYRFLPNNDMCLGSLYIIGNTEDGISWQNYSMNTDIYTVTLCSVCKGIAVNDQGEVCSACYGSGIQVDSSVAIEGFDTFTSQMRYETKPGETNGRQYLIVSVGEKSTYAVQTNINYLKSLKVECKTCHGTGEVEKAPEINGNVPVRVFNNEMKPVGLRAAKLLDGRKPTDKVFHFVLKNAEGQPVQHAYNVDANGAITGEVVFDLEAGSIASGTYTIEEEEAVYTVVENSDGTLTLNREADNTIQSYAAAVEVQIVVTDGIPSVIYPENEIPVFENTSMPGSLQIVKTIEGADEDSMAAGQAFNVEISFTDAEFAPWSGNVTVSGKNAPVEVKNGMLTVSVKAGTPVVISDIPAGIVYSAKETGSLPGWTMDQNTVTGTIAPAQQNTATFANTYAAQGEAEVQINKVLVGRQLTEGEFTFELRDKAGNLVSTATNLADGSVVFDKLTIDAAGDHRYAITEATAEEKADDTVEYGDGIDVLVNAVDEFGTGTLTTTVSYLDPADSDVEKDTIINRVKTGELSISKETISELEKHEREGFTFNVTLTDPDGEPLNGVYELEIDGVKRDYAVDNGEGTPIVLASGQTAKITGLQHGVSYTVVEEPVDGFRQESEGSAGTIAWNEAAEAKFTNTYVATGSVTFKGVKHLTGRDLTEKDVFTFLVMEGNETVAEVQNDATGKIHYPTIEYTGEDVGEHIYTVKELSTSGAGMTMDTTVYTVKVNVTSNMDGTLSVEVTEGSLTGLDFTNVYDAEGSITFEGTKTMTGRAITEKDIFSFEIAEKGTDNTWTVQNNATGKINYPKISYTLDDVGKHVYTVKENSENGDGMIVDSTEYEVTVEVTDNGDSTLDIQVSDNAKNLNFENREITEATVKKIWNDANNQDGKRPESLTVTLKNGQTVVQRVTLNEANNWTETVEALPKYANGVEITYTWTEAETELPEGYELTSTAKAGTVTTLTNSYTPETTTATVKKVWDDAENQDGKRPAGLKVTLSDGTEVTLNADNEWTATVTGLPKYANGVEIEYSWTEGAMPEGYTLTNAAKAGTVTTLTNSYEPEETEATVKKVWNDVNNADGLRPSRLIVQLSNGDTVTLNAANNWTETVTGLPKYADGVEIKYTWTEVNVPEGYTLTGNGTTGTITTLTNTHVPLTEATVKKVWADANNQDGKRPASLTVTLSNGRTVTLNEGNGWKETVTGLPKYANGVEIEYSWTEAEDELPAGYKLTSTDKEGTVTTLTNSYTPEITTATVKKVWDDANNQDGKRPTELKVTLSNGTEVTLNEGNKWTATVENLPKYADGVEIEYTWTEGAMPEGYTLTNTGVDGTITTLTNSYTPEETEATIKKIWDDANNQDGKRPTELKVTLSNGTEVTLNEGNKWTATVENLPKYANGAEIEYTWTEEDLPEGYTLTSTAKEGTVTTLTNSYTPEETEATIKKIWDDANNQDGKRPAELKVTLSNGTEVTLNEGNKWTATVTGLPKYANGVEIEYSWTEAEDELPAGYKLTSTDKEGTVTTLTNSHTPEETEATVKKVWDDANNQDGKRPTELKVTLSNGTEVTLNEGNKWTATVENLPKYANGAEIEYTWTEEDLPEGYTLTSTAKEGTVTTLTNSHTPEITTATVKKVWDDANNQDGKRPTELKVTLSNGEEVTLKEGNKWTATVDNLPKYAAGVEIEYTWTEEDLPEGYTLTSTAKEGTVTTLTNTHTPEITTATVKKVWDDANNQDGKRPTELKVTLSNGTEVTLNEGNKWTATVENLPKYADGVEIEYSWTEGAMPEGYTLTNTGVDGTVTTLTNTHTPELTEATIVKVWDDAENQDGKRPASLTVTLSNGEMVTLNADNEWTATVTGLPKYADGVEIKYTWTEAEDELPAGYKLTGNSTEGTVTTLTNSYTPEETEATIVKVWDDAENQDGKRPTELKVTLSDGTEVTLNEANGWTATVGNLPKYAAGVEIKYTWAEVNVPGYTLAGDVTNGTVTTLTNTHTPEETEATIVKVWDDAENQDGKRPTELKVTLSNGKEVTLNEANNWTATIKELPKYADGVEIKYSWTEAEDELPEGYKLTGNSTEGTVTTLTNSYTPEETEATIVKVWADAENQDGKRPAELKVMLSDGTEVTLNAENEWTATVTGLPKYANGVEIKYTWTEAEAELPEGYKLTSTDKEGTVTTLTNSYEPEETEATIVKVWDDANDQDGKRPAELKVTLSDGTEVTLNADNEWTATVTGLPKYANGVEITYTWTEGSMPEGYELTDTSVNGTITTLTNGYTPEETEATIVKVWDDANDQDGKRPTELKVTLSNGTEVTLNAANNWTDKVENLPKYANGVEITYTWTEGAMPEGYELTDTSVNGTITTLTNSYKPETTEATVKKVWADANNQDGKRPESLTVTLSNGETVTLNADNEWTATVNNLPKYANGEEIAYTWTEGSMPEGYTLTNTAKVGTITTLTNSYTPDTTMAAVKKVWIDRDNQGGSRPNSLVVKLLANGIDTGRSVTLSESNNWYAELNGLAKYNAGEEIEYAWAEIGVPDYYEQTNKTVNGTLTTFTNTYSAEGKIQFAGTKKIEGRNMTADDVFTFGIWEKVKNENGKEQEVAIATVQNDAPSGKINYPVIEYTLDDVGTHTYVVRETSKNGNGITVDTHAYAVVVIVSDNGDGTLSVVSSENATKLNFVNTYDAGIAFTLSAFKTMDGQEPADDQVFNFICRDEQTQVELAAQNENGSITFGPISFGLKDAGKTFTYTIWEETESSEYVIADESVYTVYLTIKDAGNGTLKADHVIKCNGEAADTVIFNNRAVAPLTISKKVENVQTSETFKMVVHFFDSEKKELEDAFAYTGDAKGTIVSGGSIELGHDQSVTIHGLPVGTRYTVKEEGSLAYTTTVNGEAGREIEDEIIPDENNRVDFVNTMETTTFSVTKVWDDGRSDEIQLTLYANGVKMDPQPAYTRQGSMYVYDNLPWYDENGEVIVYSAKEKGIEGYLTIYNNIDPYKDKTKFIYDGGTIINRPEQVKELSFQIRKIWQNMNGEEPQQIELKLYCNGVEMNKPTPKPDRNGWYKYYNLPKTVNGQPAVYTVVEVPLAGYATFYEDANGSRMEYGVNGGTIINEKLPKTGDSQSAAMWMLMLSMSLGGMLMLMKRKAKA